MLKQNFQSSINTQSGNILVYILGAIVLIGILVTLVKGSSTPGSGIDREALEIRVAEVQQYGNELERAVAYVLRNGYSETDIRFAHPNHSSAYGDITDDPGRQIFAREGGGATWRDNPDDIQTSDKAWAFTGRNNIQEVGVTCSTGNGCTELVAFLEDVTLDFCLLVNSKNNITNPSNMPPQDVGGMVRTPFDGLFTHITTIGDTTTTDGKLEGCLEGDGFPPAGTYHYYRVLLAR